MVTLPAPRRLTVAAPPRVYAALPLHCCRIRTAPPPRRRRILGTSAALPQDLGGGAAAGGGKEEHYRREEREEAYGATLVMGLLGLFGPQYFKRWLY